MAAARGGRQAFLYACKSSSVDACVDLWGGRVVQAEDDRTEKQPVQPIDATDILNCPLLGIFGNDDRSPSPEEVDQHEEVLKSGKNYEFHRYDDGAGPGSSSIGIGRSTASNRRWTVGIRSGPFSVNTCRHRERYMCISIVEVVEAEGAGCGKNGWFPVTRAVVTYDHPQVAPFERDNNLDFMNPDRSASDRAGVELTLEAAKAFHAALSQAVAEAEAEEREHGVAERLRAA